MKIGHTGRVTAVSILLGRAAAVSIVCLHGKFNRHAKGAARRGALRGGRAMAAAVAVLDTKLGDGAAVRASRHGVAVADTHHGKHCERRRGGMHCTCTAQFRSGYRLTAAHDGGILHEEWKDSGSQALSGLNKSDGAAFLRKSEAARLLDGE